MKKQIFTVTLVMTLAILCSACAAPAEVQPTYTAMPTYTPYPTYTVAPVEAAATDIPVLEIVRPDGNTTAADDTAVEIVRPDASSSDTETMIQAPTALPTVQTQAQASAPVLSYSTNQTVQKAVEYGSLAPLPIQPYSLSSGQTIQFALGATSAVVSGTVPANGVVTYNLYAMAKQNFVAVLSSSTGTAVLGITDDRGEVYLDSSQNSTYYNMYLPRTATYYVDIFGMNAGTDFTLQIFIPARVTIPMGETSTYMDGVVAAYRVVSYTAYMYAGQTAKIDVYSGATPTAFLRITGMGTGAVYLDYTSYMPSWYAIVPATQDYMIEVITLNQSANYRLTVNVQ